MVMTDNLLAQLLLLSFSVTSNDTAEFIGEMSICARRLDEDNYVFDISSPNGKHLILDAVVKARDQNLMRATGDPRRGAALKMREAVCLMSLTA
jgi:hypothetical protein